MEKNIEYKELKITDINNNMLDYYNRYQEVKKCYRKEEENWVLKNFGFQIFFEPHSLIIIG